MRGYLGRLGPGVKCISKISVQTGTRHGGVVLPDGSVAKVQLDFKTLEDLSLMARDEYGLAGAVQHGASTLPDDAFGLFPRVGAAEVHLATGFQNMIFDSQYFPRELLDEIHKFLAENYFKDKAPGETEEQFFYKVRKQAFGDFKQEMWDLPQANLDGIGAALEARFSQLFEKLNVLNTVALVNKYITR
jgi:hypothetical protein